MLRIRGRSGPAFNVVWDRNHLGAVVGAPKDSSALSILPPACIVWLAPSIALVFREAEQDLDLYGSTLVIGEL
jgi:hypothetical protein